MGAHHDDEIKLDQGFVLLGKTARRVAECARWVDWSRSGLWLTEDREGEVDMRVVCIDDVTTGRVRPGYVYARLTTPNDETFAELPISEAA